MEQFLHHKDRDQLRDLCRAGRLFNVEELLEEKGTCRLRRTRKWTPLFFAVDRGFHSLVEVLLRYPHADWDLEKGYWGAISRKRGDLAALIVRAGYDPGETNIVSALASGDADLVRLLLGRSPQRGSNWAVSIAILRAPFEVAKLIPVLSDFVPDLEVQLYAGMVSLADRGRLRPVVPYLKYGLDPRKEGVVIDERDKPVCEMTTIEAACGSEDLGLVKMLKPSPDLDDAFRLISRAFVTSLNRGLLELLIECGFDMNCDPGGGCPVLDDVLCSPTYRVFDEMSFYTRRRSAFLSVIPDVTWLVERGARWIPRDSQNYRSFRDNLLDLGKPEAERLIETMASGGALGKEHEQRLLKNPRMQKLLM
ncbi:ankyrin repeat domain-containing protein [Verrucomicrobiales bacterium]|nr:ankyrin repeat domain-containing protein [Verrucomicrobiales bacterium]